MTKLEEYKEDLVGIYNYYQQTKEEFFAVIGDNENVFTINHKDEIILMYWIDKHILIFKNKEELCEYLKKEIEEISKNDSNTN
jgi:hypothetical protein